MSKTLLQADTVNPRSLNVRIVEFGAVDAVLDSPQHDYTRKLLADTPSLETVYGAKG